MTDRPDKWKRLERITKALFEAAHLEGRHEVRDELAREFGPLLDAAEAVVASWSATGDSVFGAKNLNEQLEKFR